MRAAGAGGLSPSPQTPTGGHLALPPRGVTPRACPRIVESLLHFASLRLTKWEVLCKGEACTGQGAGRRPARRIPKKTAPSCAAKEKKGQLSMCLPCPQSKAFVLHWLILKKKKKKNVSICECLDVPYIIRYSFDSTNVVQVQKLLMVGLLLLNAAFCTVFFKKMSME